MTTHPDDELDVDQLDVLDFTSSDFTTTAYKKVSTTVDLLGEDVDFHRPKDGVLFFVQSAVADTANDADRWMAALRFLESSLTPQSRKRFLDRACDRSDPLNASALWDTIGELLRRWDPKTKIPASQKIVIEHRPDAAEGYNPVRIVDEALRLDFIAYPPKDIVLGFTGSAIAASASPAQQAWCVNLFLDGSLDGDVALELSYRLQSPAYGDDKLDLPHLLGIVRSLIERWYSGTNPNRAARRAQASQSRKSAPKVSRAVDRAPEAEEREEETTPPRRRAPAKKTAEGKPAPRTTKATVKPASRKTSGTARSSRKRTISGEFEEE